MNNDIQQQTDVNQARTRLEEIASRQQQKNENAGGAAEKAPPGLITRPQIEIGKQKMIHPVEKKPEKKKFGQKLKESLFGDNVGNGSITEHIFFNVMIPSIKRVAVEMINIGANMLFGLDPKTRTVSASTNTHTANASLYRDRNYSRGGGYGLPRREAISEFEWDLETADDIYCQIGELFEHYSNVTIANVYSIMNMPTRIRATDNAWGWTSMNGITMDCVYRDPIHPEKDRYIINMPPARQL